MASHLRPLSVAWTCFFIRFRFLGRGGGGAPTLSHNHTARVSCPFAPVTGAGRHVRACVRTRMRTCVRACMCAAYLLLRNATIGCEGAEGSVLDRHTHTPPLARPR
ncbi:MAG: hypothetical protein J3K34DRAFT_57084 [Monoraphidium minutum]|nr:MAG: hypothetical protein J3K34DRAFT_57084 [Monoraphidium minutum]